MFICFEDRRSESPLVERVWRSHSTTGGAFHSMAESNLELVVSRLPTMVTATLRGPVTRASVVECPPRGEWLAIRFRPGVYFPSLPTYHLLDHHSLDLPVVDRRRFWFSGLLWDLPTYENAEELVERFRRSGVIACDSVIDAAIAGDPHPLSQRSVQRHFLRVTGLTHGQFSRIERARLATGLLRSGSPILDVVADAGYFDQAHLTRSLRTLIGLTPARLLHNEAQLSFSYKTTES